jgi:hypothetical protein
MYKISCEEDNLIFADNKEWPRSKISIVCQVLLKFQKKKQQRQEK